MHGIFFTTEARRQGVNTKQYFAILRASENLRGLSMGSTAKPNQHF